MATSKSPKPPRFSPRKRSKARRKTMQALYQWQIAAQSLISIEQQFLLEEDMRDVDIPYFQRLLHEIPKHKSEFDEKLAPLLDRPVAQLDPVEHAILWLGLYELFYAQDVPWKAVINEAVELCKSFGAEQSHKYVNGVLDKVARNIQQASE